MKELHKGSVISFGETVEKGDGKSPTQESFINILAGPSEPFPP